MLALREATRADLDFLVEIDWEGEGYSPAFMDNQGSEEQARHRDKIAAFLSDEGKAAWVYEATETGRLIAMMLWRYRNRLQETFEDWSIFPQLDVALFPGDGAFCEVFQLWVAPEYRRRGVASSMKRQAEMESLCRGVKALYTHTEARNTHVIEMNRKLGYQEVWRGPIWDEVVRVSLIKTLD